MPGELQVHILKSGLIQSSDGGGGKRWWVIYKGGALPAVFFTLYVDIEERHQRA